MTKTRTVIVRRPRSGAVLEWRPSSEHAPLRELVQMLEEDPESADAAPIDLMDQDTARLLDPESEVGELGAGVLVAKGRFFRHALDQLEALQVQIPSLMSFTPMADAPVISVELRVPALQVLFGKAAVRIRGRHQLLVVLPSTFPEAQPRLVWLTPIFHPNVIMDRDVWPPGLAWGNGAGLITLLSALIDTVAGLNVSVRGRLSLSRRRPLNDLASPWFRKHGPQVADYGRRSLCVDMWRPEQLPLSSSNEAWVLQGSLHGGGPLVFLSGRSHRGLERFAKHAAGWLHGTRGLQGERPWYYIDRVVPWRPGTEAPPGAIGLLERTGAIQEQVWSEPDAPIIAACDDDGISLRTGAEGARLSGYFVEDDITPADVTPPLIRVGPVADTEPTEIPELGTDPEPSLIPISLVAAVCPYCGGTCGPDRAWGACPECATDTHADCHDQIGGCPDTSCSLCPLYLGSAARAPFGR